MVLWKMKQILSFECLLLGVEGNRERKVLHQTDCLKRVWVLSSQRLYLSLVKRWLKDLKVKHAQDTANKPQLENRGGKPSKMSYHRSPVIICCSAVCLNADYMPGLSTGFCVFSSYKFFSFFCNRYYLWSMIHTFFNGTHLIRFSNVLPLSASVLSKTTF